MSIATVKARTPAVRWRSKPEWKGQVADGWFLDSGGRLRFQPNPQDALDKLAAMLADPPPPMVQAYPIDGKLPSPAQLIAVRAELAKAPRAVIDEWRARGGHLEVVPGGDCSRHPQAPGRCYGFCYGDLIVVAGERGLAVLHEAGHMHDQAKIRGGRFSATAEWRAIHRRLPPHIFARDLWRGDAYYRSDPLESFAECFAKYYHDGENRAELPADVRRFILGTVAGA
jgi:hypothetical protein